MGSRYSPRRRETLPPVKHFVKSKMPFIQREVRPVLLAQDAGKTVADQEDLQSRILANIMDQLGDLGRHAVDIMDGIGKECEEVNQRMAQLSQRLDKEINPTFLYKITSVTNIKVSCDKTG